MKEVLETWGEVSENVDLKKYNTYGIGGKAKYLIRPTNILNVQLLVSYLKKEKKPFYILGMGSNVILPDADYDGVIIRLDNLNKLTFQDAECEVEGGLSLSKLVSKTLAKGYVNLRFAQGIPGLLGAAIVGNVGAFKHEIFEYVKNVTFLNEKGQIETLEKSNISYSYRDTMLKKRNVIILKATLILEKGDVALAKKEIHENLLKRQATQPLNYPNAGSVFKNPVGFSAGKLIDEAHLKGKTIGGARISEKHANFIVNFHNAQSRDIIKLITLIKKTIKEKDKIDLELEQVIVKW